MVVLRALYNFDPL